ncbi:MAG TPA: hypothetical protein VM261_14300 [Kofleriaceae bacterium]|nr:hypothetical protein [Kofleriaceae bacterium]
MTRALVIAFALALAPAIAAAQPAAAPPAGNPADEPEDKPIKPDRRAVAEAREANLEPESARSGLAVGVAFGPNVQVSSGIANASGTGGGFALRFGTVASPRWVWLAEIATTAFRQLDMVDNDYKLNSSTLFTLGGQLYVKEAFWLRGGGGFANFTRRAERGGDPTESLSGVGVIGAGGLDVIRRKSVAVSLEVLTTLARYRGGFVGAGTMQLGLSWY